MGAKPPPHTWTSKIYGFQGIFWSQQVLSPPLEKKIKASPGQTSDYAPDWSYLKPNLMNWWGRWISELVIQIGSLAIQLKFIKFDPW